MAPLLTLVIIGIGFAVMLGAVRLRTLPILFLLLFMGTTLLPTLGPMMEAFTQAGWQIAQELPLWVRLVVLALLGIAALRLALALLLGWRAADSVAASLTTDLIRGVVRMVLLPVRAGRRFFRSFFGR